VKWLEAQKPPPRGEGGAKVVASFAEGSAVLAGEKGEISLAWDPKGPAPEAPPGTYRVRTLRIARGSFLISSAGLPAPPLVVKETTELKIDEIVRFDGNARRRGRALQLGFSIKGADGRGLTIYKAGARVPVKYRSSRGTARCSRRAR
jgi:hypothetical protein